MAREDVLPTGLRAPARGLGLFERLQDGAGQSHGLGRGDEPAALTLAQEVWGLDAATDQGVVNVYVNYLRNKLEGGDRSARLIHTVRGVGYVLSEAAPD